MSLTRGGGPLATPGPADVNYTVKGPKHRLFLHPFGRRVRAELGGETVLDTTGAFLLHESNLLPVLYVPIGDVRAELVKTARTTHCPFKGDASYWTLRAGGEERPDSVWGYEAPMEAASWLAGLVAFYMDRLDAWWDEDEPIRGHVRDPYHRVDVRRSSRRVRVTQGDELLAESSRPLLVAETGMANRWYLPREDVSAELADSATTSHCPYKGDARYFTVGGVEDAAWAYDEPFDGTSLLAGHVSFEGAGITVSAD